MRRDFGELEKRRMQAARLLEKGYSEAEVARRVDVSRQSINRWARSLRAGGRVALKRAGRAGRRPKLSEADLVRIEQCLKQGPEQFGYQTGLWTLPRVRRLIEAQCGVRYHPSQVWRILRKLNWSCQRPSGRALERDEEAIRRWKRYRWPQIKKKPSASGAPSSSSTKAG
jgi:transposase